MSFATEIDRPRSYRHVLVRITPARYVVDDLAAVGGVYQMTFPYPVARVERNGTALTEDQTTPTTNDHWCHDEATGTLKVKLAGAPSASNVVVVFFHLFYASQAVSAYETPTDATTPVRPWEPRLVDEPRFVHALSDVFYGVLSVHPTTVMLRNSDDAFQAFLTPDDSFCNKAVDVWLDVNGQLQHVFAGLVAEIGISNGIVNVTAHDPFEKLAQSAFMGDSIDEAYYLTSVYSTMSPTYNFRPCRYVVGRTRHNFKNFDTDGLARYPYVTEGGGSTTSLLQILDWSACEEAVPLFQIAIDASPYNGLRNRGPWGLCRTGPEGLKTLDFGSFTSAVVSEASTAAYWYLDYDFRARLRFTYTTDNHNLEVGDGFRWSHPSVNSGALHAAVVMGVSPGIVDCLVTTIQADTAAATTTTVTSGTFTPNAAPALCIRSEQTSGTRNFFHFVAYLVEGLDYTLNVTTLPSGNKFYTATIIDNLHNATVIGGSGFRQPSTAVGSFPHEQVVFFRATSAQASNKTRHDNVLKTVLEAAGLTVDTATFAAAGAALTAKASFTIPPMQETTYRTYFELVQSILGSTFGYVYPGTDGEVEYKLVAAPSASASDAATASEILVGPPSIAIDYRDIVTEITMTNSHLPPGDYRFPTATSTAEDARARRLHGVEKKLVVESVLEDQARISALLAARSSRRATYSFSFSTKLLDKLIGEDIQLAHAGLLGGAATDDMKVVTLTKSARDVFVEATDLEGI